jgi:hypothetical protein
MPVATRSSVGDPGLPPNRTKYLLPILLLALLPPLLGYAQRGATSNSTLHGTVTDLTGAMIPGAKVTLKDSESHEKLIDITDNSGAFYFTNLPADTYSIKVTFEHFATSITAGITLQAGEDTGMPPIALRPTSDKATVVVHAYNYELAQQQLQIEEKQRVLGVFPNFYVTYEENPAPLSPGQKFRLAFRDTLDPTNLVIVGITAGAEQAADDIPDFGQGTAGYAKRFGVNFADGLVSDMLAGAVLPVLLHQDPRYFYKGTGSIHGRLFYALASSVRCKGDNGKWQPNYSNVFGNLAASGISNLYYPAADRRGLQLTMDNALIGIGSDAIAAVIQEFWLKEITPGARKKKQDD